MLHVRQQGALIEVLINIVLLCMLCMTAVAVIRLKHLFGVVMLSGVYSLISALIFVVLDAVDVAFTEAAVAAGISTVLMLATLVVTGRAEKPTSRSPLLPLAVVTVTGAVLIRGTFDMPGFGVAQNPVHVHVADRYIAESASEIGIPNIVTSVLASYRGYDTMGEVIVVFTALIGVLSLIGIKKKRSVPNLKHNQVNGNSAGAEVLAPRPILQVMALLLIPFIFLFALYVQFHGDFGPGGGFQAGVMFAAAIILYTLTFSLDDALTLMPATTIKVLAALGVLIYGGTGVIAMLRGGGFLDYDFLSSDPVAGQHLGILIIEFGVGMTVAAVMIAIFFAFDRCAEDTGTLSRLN